MSVVKQGQCLCGAVRISATLPDETLEICHCTMCQAWVGGPYVATQMTAEARVEGEEHVRLYRSSDHAERAFCDTCGSALYFRYLPTGNRSFLAGLFADLAGPIQEEIFIDQKPAWLSIEGNRPRLTRAEVLAKFGFDE